MTILSGGKGNGGEATLTQKGGCLVQAGNIFVGNPLQKLTAGDRLAKEDRFCLSQAAEDFRQKCFQPEPNNRHSASELLRHRYLSLPTGWSFPGISEIGEIPKNQGAFAGISSPALTMKLGVPSPNSSDRNRMQKMHRPVTPPLVHIAPPGPRQHNFQQPSDWVIRKGGSWLTPDDSGSQRASRRLVVYNPDTSDNASSQPSSHPYTYKPPPLPGINNSSPYSAHLAPLPRAGLSNAMPKALAGSSPLVLHTSQSSYNNDSPSDIDTDFRSTSSTWKRLPADLVPARRQRNLDVPSPKRFAGNILSSSHPKPTGLSTFRNPRPPAYQVIENLEEFFPGHNLDDPVVESPDQPTLPSEVDSNLNPCPSRRCTMKSIKSIVGEQINQMSLADRRDRRSTWLWDSHVEEIKVPK